MFIVFEGIDGAGTTTQAGMLATALRANGIDTILTAEPTDRAIGRFIRAALSGKQEISPRALQLLFFADRQEHLDKEIFPELNKKKIIISDRYYQSSIAYGALSGNFEFCKDISRHFPEPSLTIFLDISADQAIERIDNRGGEKEIFEKKESLAIIADAYRRLFDEIPDEKKLVLDATRSKAELAEAIFHEVRGRSSAG